MHGSDLHWVSMSLETGSDDIAHESDAPDALAEIAYGDEKLAAETGQSQIVVTSRSESAVGKEREQINNFGFDKVRDYRYTLLKAE